MNNLLQEMMNSVERANDASDVTFSVLTGAVDAPVLHDGQSIPTLSTRIRDYIQTAVAAGDLDGEDGASIEELYIDPADGHMYVRLTGEATPTSLGKIVPEDGLGIKDATYDDVTGILEFVLDDNSTVPVGNIKGDTGTLVKNVRIFRSDLLVTVEKADGSIDELNAGDISRFGGISASDVEINERGNLEVIFSDGTTKVLGRVVGERGKNGSNIISSWMNPNGELHFLFDDGRPSVVTNPINLTIVDDSQNTVETIRYDDVSGELFIKLSGSTTEQSLGIIKGEDGIDGIDGVNGKSVKNVYVDSADGDLKVLLETDAGDQVVPVGPMTFLNTGDQSLSVTGASIDTDPASLEYGILTVNYDLNGTIDSFKTPSSIIGTDGNAGSIIDSASIVNNILSFSVIDHDGTPRSVVAGAIPQGYVQSIDVDATDGYLYTTLSDGITRKRINTPTPLKGNDGANGLGVTDVNIVNGDLVFDLYNFDTKTTIQSNSGKVVAPYEVKADVINNELRITLSDGTVKDGLIKVNGDDGEYITNAELLNGELIIETNIPTSTNNKKFALTYRQPDSVSINSANQLMFTLTDTTELTTTTRVVPYDGDGITAIAMDANDIDLVIDYSTGNRTGTATEIIKAVKGVGISKVDVVTKSPEMYALEFKTNENGASALTTHSVDIPKGIDGYEIKDIYFDGLDLVIEHDNPAITDDRATIPAGANREVRISNVKGKTLDSISYDNTDEQLIVEVSGEAPLKVDMPKAVERHGVTAIEYVVADDQLVIDTTLPTGTTKTIEIGDIRGKDGLSIDTIGMKASEPDTFEIILSDGTPPIEFKQLKGADAAESVTSIEFVGQDLVVKKPSGDITLSLIRGTDATNTINDIYIDGGALVIDSTLTATPLRFEQIVGANGEGMTDISFLNETLVITTNMAAPNDKVEIPMVRGVDGDTINGISIDAGALVIDNSITATPLRFEQLVGTDGDGITSVSFVGETLVIETNQAAPNDKLEIPMVRGETGTYLTNVTTVDNIDTVSVTFSFNDIADITFDQLKGRDGDSILDARVEGNDFVLETNILGKEEIRISAIKGNDGIGIQSITPTGNTLELITTENQTVNIVIPEGESGTTIKSIDKLGSDILITTIDDALAEKTYLITSILGVDGIDGLNVATMVVDGNDLVVTMDDITDAAGVAKAPTEYRMVSALKYVTGASIVNKKLHLDFSDGSSLDTLTDVVGRDGKGRGINDVTFTNGSLDITYIEADGVVSAPANVGSVSMNSVVDATIDTVTGMLTFVYADTTTHDVGIVYGRDGRYVASVRVDTRTDATTGEIEDILIMIMDNNDEIEAGNIRGAAGRSILPEENLADPNHLPGIEVTMSGDLIVRYDDATSEVAGNLGGGVGLTVWSIDETYAKDRVVVHDGGMYMSLEDLNTDKPPSIKWNPLSVGDQIVEVRKPENQSPANGNVAYTVKPTLIASPFAAIVSLDVRDYREFQVALEADVEFTTIEYTFTTDTDGHEVGVNLVEGSNYIWRCRDVSNRGFISAWSEPTMFVVPQGTLETPTLAIDDLEDSLNAFNAPHFIGTAFSNLHNTEIHTATDWVITDSLDVEVWSSLGNTTDLEDITIPYDVLTAGTSYKIKAKYRAVSIESAWSPVFEFTTEATFDYFNTPVIAYDGDTESVERYTPTFNGSVFSKTTTFAANSFGIPAGHETSDWEVISVATTAEVESSLADTINLRNYTIQAALENQARYRIRVRYFNSRFGYTTWSNWVEFKTNQFIEQPVVSLDPALYDPLNVLVGDVFESTAFVGTNEVHISTDWRMLDLFSGAVIFESLNDTTNLTSLVFDLSANGPYNVDGRDLIVQARYNGNDAVSEWSPNTFQIFTWNAQ